MVGLTGYIVTEFDPSVLAVGELLLKLHKLASLKNHIPSQRYHVMRIFLLKMCYILKLASRLHKLKDNPSVMRRSSSGL